MFNYINIYTNTFIQIYNLRQPKPSTQIGFYIPMKINCEYMRNNTTAITMNKKCSTP